MKLRLQRSGRHLDLLGEDGNCYRETNPEHDCDNRFPLEAKEVLTQVDGSVQSRIVLKQTSLLKES